MANKLYPIPAISQQIEDFAKDMLLSAVNGDHLMDTDGSNAEVAKACEPYLSQPRLPVVF